MDRIDSDRQERLDRELKEFEHYVHHQLATDIVEGRHQCLFVFGRCICGKVEDAAPDGRMA